jgi:hypothetical protein
MPDNEAWIWCMKCERCYTLIEVPQRAPDSPQLSLLKCPYSNCGASYLSKGLPWLKVRELFPYLGFPEVPRMSKVYSSDPFARGKLRNCHPQLPSWMLDTKNSLPAFVVGWSCQSASGQCVPSAKRMYARPTSARGGKTGGTTEYHSLPML